MPHVLEEMTVLDPDGHQVRLGDLWAQQAAVLVFVRHFRCLFCRQQIAELSAQRERIQSLGAELVVIGHGTVEEARAFRSEQRAPLRVFTDPARETYAALAMRRGRQTVLTPRVAMRAAKALWLGFRQTGIAGDPLQQGGVLVMTPRGEERYRFISRDAGDHAPLVEIFAALQPRG